MILFFDTETSGMVQRNRGPGDFQPHIVQLAALLVADDGYESCMNMLIRPDGWEIGEEAARVHGITMERATKDGVPLWRAIWEFDRLVQRAVILVAHNIDFDMLMVLSEYGRLEVPPLFDGKELYCTMKASTEICCLPGPYGYKWPKLAEAFKHFTGKDLENAHDALADLRACRIVYERLTKKPPTQGVSDVERVR